jgi:prophage regulatory protein
MSTTHAALSDTFMGERILRKPEVRALTGLSDVTVWRLERAGLFPRHIQISRRSVGWRLADVLEYLRARRQGSK